MDSSSDAVKRRLAAILAADATNYSGLVARDEESALRALAIHRAAIDETIANHAGRIFATAGDSVLAEFSSPVQAVRAAIEMQHALVKAREQCALRAPMLFRIGVNVGDVVVDGDNILGDGVNLAVRLENLAAPGGICVAANVRDHVLGKVDCRFQDLGTQFLKNIPRPVRAFQVIADHSDCASLRTRMRKIFPRATIAGAAVVLLATIASWSFVQPPAKDPISQDLARAPGAGEKREEFLYWESIRHTNEPAELRNYLAKYPHGAFADLAKTRLEGIFIGESRVAEEKAAAAKHLEAEQAQQEARRLKQDAEQAIARATSEQNIVARLRAEAEQAAARAAAAARSADEAQQKLARTQNTYASSGEERLTFVRTASPLDGRWMSELNCHAASDQPMSSTQLPVRIQFREIRIESGQVGLPGYFRAYGNITEDGSFQLQGVSLPRTQRIVGAEDSIRVSGHTIDHNRLEGNGTIGERRCSLAFNRLATQ